MRLFKRTWMLTSLSLCILCCSNLENTLKEIEKTPLQIRTIDIQSWTTQSGSKVLFSPSNEIEMLDVRLTFSAGAARDGNQFGISSLTSALLGEGSSQNDVEEIAQRFESMGTQFSSGAYRDMAVAEMRTLSKALYLDPSLKLFTEIIANPTFPEKSFQRIKKQSIIQLKAQEQSPRSIAHKKLFKSIYQNHPYGNSPNEKSISELEANDLRKFHLQYYVAKNMTIAIVGNISQEKAVSLSEDISNAFPTGQSAPKVIAALETKASEHSIAFPSSQTHILLGSLGIKRNNPDYIALYLGNEILGGSGAHSQLNKLIREEHGLSYSVYSHSTAMLAKGPFMISLQTQNKQAELASQLTKDKLAEFIKNGPNEDELKRAKRHIIGSFPISIASNGSIISYLSNIGFYNLPLDYISTFPNKIETISSTDIQHAFSKNIKLENMHTIFVGGPDE